MTQPGKDDRMPHTGDAAVPTADAGEAVSHLGQDDADDVKREKPTHPHPRQAGGLSTGLQPGGTVPGGGPGASVGSVGTGGAPTGNAPSGGVKKTGI